MIQAILLDADGVLQSTDDRFLSDLKGLVPAAQSESFAEAVFAAEVPALAGEENFADVLQILLNQYGVTQSVGTVLSLWYQIRIWPGMLPLVASLRTRGLLVGLATNQQVTRMSYMRNQMKLDEHFDHSFYSCEQGAMKPNPDYFTNIIKELQLPPADVLFIDDSPRNVEGAERCGIRARQFIAAHHPDPASALSELIQQNLSGS